MVAVAEPGRGDAVAAGGAEEGGSGMGAVASPSPRPVSAVTPAVTPAEKEKTSVVMCCACVAFCSIFRVPLLIRASGGLFTFTDTVRTVISIIPYGTGKDEHENTPHDTPKANHTQCPGFPGLASLPSSVKSQNLCQKFIGRKVSRSH